jgi:uncharacterized protein YeaO (DUF488 family)
MRRVTSRDSTSRRTGRDVSGSTSSSALQKARPFSRRQLYEAPGEAPARGDQKSRGEPKLQAARVAFASWAVWRLVAARAAERLIQTVDLAATAAVGGRAYRLARVDGAARWTLYGTGNRRTIGSIEIIQVKLGRSAHSFVCMYRRVSQGERYSPSARPMAIRIVRLGTPRLPKEGLRVGTVRRPPRGVRKEDYAARDFYDVWLPELAPTAELVSWAMVEPMAGKRWTAFARRYRTEMSAPAACHLIELLAAMSKESDLSVGCYCEDESHCHRALLRGLLAEAGASIE